MDRAAPTQRYAPFDYSSLDRQLQPWLRRKTCRLRDFVQLTAVVAVKIGRELIKTKERLPDRTFRRWVAAELPWSISKVSRLMQVARTFVDADVGKFSASALYVLCWPGAPESARSEALAMVREGHAVTHRIARELLELHRNKPPGEEREPPAQIGARKPKAEKVDYNPVAEASEIAADAAAWRNMREAAAKFGTVHISRVDDEDYGPTFTIAGLLESGKTRTVTRADFGMAAGALVENESMKLCKKCKEPLALGRFSLDARTPDGRNRRCRDCEAKRREERRRKERAGGAMPKRRRPPV